MVTLTPKELEVLDIIISANPLKADETDSISKLVTYADIVKEFRGDISDCTLRRILSRLQLLTMIRSNKHQGLKGNANGYFPTLSGRNAFNKYQDTQKKL